MLTRLIKALSGGKYVQRPSWCSVCGSRTSFLPLPKCYHENALRYGFSYFGQGEMASLETYTCSSCGASDRERLYALWVDRQIAKNQFPKNARTIHFAPEAALSRRLKGLEYFDYKTADLSMDNVDHKIDMMAMPFDDESCDFFICSHVLEHVESDDEAIKELYRITKLGGCGILMAPIIVGLEKTVEEPDDKDEARRWKLYGQNDHVRLYSHKDYINKIGSHGFRVEEFGKDYFGENMFRSLGLKASSILYVANK